MLLSLRPGLPAASTLKALAELLSHFEKDGSSGQDKYLLAGLWILSLPGPMPSDLEGSESPDLDLLPPQENPRHCIEQGIDRYAYISI